MRLWLLHLLQADEDALRAGYLEQVVQALEAKIDTLQNEKTAMRASIQHWRRLYFDATGTQPPPD